MFMRGRWLLLSFCCIGSIYFYNHYFFVLLIFIFYCIKNRDRSCYCCLVLILLFNRLSQPVWIEPAFKTGKVVDIKSNSVILDIEGVRVIGYNFDPAYLDETVSFEGEFTWIESSPTTYGFDYEKWCHQNKIYYSVYAKNVQSIRPGNSIRGKLQRKIEGTDNRIREFLMKTIFSSSFESNNSLDELLVLSGTHISTLFRILEYVLSFFLSGSEWITLIFMILTGSVFHFKFIYIRLILEKILSFTSLDSKDRLGILILLLILTDVHCIYSVSFLFPILLKLIRCFDRNDGFIKRTFTLGFIQSLFNHEVKLLQIFFFSLLQKMIAIEMILSLISLVVPSISSVVLFLIDLTAGSIQLMDGFLEFRGSFQFPLTCALIFYLCSFKNSNHIKAYLIISSVLIFNVNHWTASVNFINVGQGDSILIQLPFNLGNYLIDTGPVSSYSNLKSFLFAKGVKKIKGIFITHYDEDHAGNLDLLCKDFNVTQIIDDKWEEYHDPFFSMRFLLPDYQSSDPNENSLILMCEINQLRFLFLGDITAAEERLLVQTYDDLTVDIVKLAHHGSSTSTSERLLDQIHAKYAIISCGLNNRYHHPSSEVMERLIRYPIPIHVYSTSSEGDISFILTRFCNFICISVKFLI